MLTHLKDSHNTFFVMVKISTGKLPSFSRKFGPETFRSEIEPMSDNCLRYIRNFVVKHFKNTSKIFFSFLFFQEIFIFRAFDHTRIINLKLAKVDWAGQA